MPLNLGTGNIKPYVNSTAKPTGNQEIDRPTFIIDFPNRATGWFRFREGQAPERRINPSLDRMAPCPGEDFKRGFCVMLYSQQYFGGAVEFSSASTHVGDAINEIYDVWESERDQSRSGTNTGRTIDLCSAS